MSSQLVVIALNVGAAFAFALSSSLKHLSAADVGRDTSTGLLRMRDFILSTLALCRAKTRDRGFGGRCCGWFQWVCWVM